MPATLDLSAENLATSAHLYRQELLQLPVISLEESLRHMTIRPGIRYKETVGELGGTVQLGPYSDTRTDDSDVVVNARTLETFLGSVVKNFKPNAIYQSIWGSSITKGEALKTVDAARTVLAFMAAQIGKNLNKSLFNAKRKDTGTTTADLFNGFDTICATEEAATNLSAANGNLLIGSEAITASNAIDILKTFYRSASDELRAEQTKLFIPQAVYDAYVDDYQTTVGSTPYNIDFDKTYLEGSRGRCELVPLASKADASYLQLTTQNNMLIGVDQMSDTESVEVEKHAPFVLQFVATMFFGVQFESIAKERIMVYKLKTT